MAQNIISCGDVIQVPAEAAIVSGAPVIVGSLFGIALNSAAIGEVADVQLEGVALVNKTTGQAWTQGALLYWVSGTSKFSTTSSGNTLAGAAFAAAGSADATGYLRLKQ